MPDYILYNGSYHKSESALIGADNRGLRYGDGLFETLRLHAGDIFFSEYHFERLFHGLQLLCFQLPGYFTAQFLQQQVVDLCKKNGHSNARVRINIFRGNGGLYDPENHFPNCIIQSWPLEQTGYQFNDNGLVTGVYPRARKSIDSFSNVKSNNYLAYTMAALYAKQEKWNDAFLLNSDGAICDATIANVFLVKDGIVVTPPLGDGCIAGIMRRFLLEKMPSLGFTVRELSIFPDDLMAADEVFLTNAVKGIRWVQHFDTVSYGGTLTNRIYTKLLKNLQ